MNFLTKICDFLNLTKMRMIQQTIKHKQMPERSESLAPPNIGLGRAPAAASREMSKRLVFKFDRWSNLPMSTKLQTWRRKPFNSKPNPS